MMNIRKLLVLALVLFPLLAGFSSAANSFSLTSNAVTNSVIDVGQYSTINVIWTGGGLTPYTANWVWTTTNTPTLSNTIKAGNVIVSPAAFPITFNAYSITNAIFVFNGVNYQVNALQNPTNTIFGKWTFTFTLNDIGANTIQTFNTITVNNALAPTLSATNTVSVDQNQFIVFTAATNGGSASNSVGSGFTYNYIISNSVSVLFSNVVSTSSTSNVFIWQVNSLYR